MSVLILTENTKLFDKYNNCNDAIWGSKRYITEKNIDCEHVVLQYDGTIPYEDTHNILRTVNDYLESLCDDEYKLLFLASYHLEGGDLGWSICCFCMALHTVKSILENKKIEKVVICPCQTNKYECDAAWILCKQEKIEFVIDGTQDRVLAWEYKTPVLKRLVLQERSYKEQKNVFFQPLFSRDKAKKIKEYDVGLMLMSSAVKHLNWLQGWILALQKEALEYNVICLDKDANYDKLLKANVPVKCMKDYIDKRYLKNTWRKYRKFKANHKKNRIGDICYLNYDIKAIIGKYVDSYVYYQIMDNIHVDILTESYFKYNNYRYVRAWGDSNFIHTRSAYYHTRNSNTFFFKEVNESLEDWDSKYEPWEQCVALRFVAGNKRDIPWEKNHLIKVYWYEQKNTDKIEVNVLDEKLRILFAPSNPLEGYHSLSAWKKNLEDIISAVRTNVFEIKIKLHPNTEKELYVNKITENIWYDILAPIEKTLEYCDVVITTPSLVIDDAIKKDKIVICVIEDFQSKFVEKYQGEIILVNTVYEALSIIKKYINNPEECMKWKKSIIIKQHKIYNQIYSGGMETYVTNILDGFHNGKE